MFLLGNKPVLAPYNGYSYVIELKGSILLILSRIYLLAERELKVLYTYLNNILAKEWIQLSKSSIGAPILFIPKKGGELQLYIDYYTLNKITKKN
jgi:hypothetical protein